MGGDTNMEIEDGDFEEGLLQVLEDINKSLTIISTLMLVSFIGAIIALAIVLLYAPNIFP
jgi:hypothetical protein